MVIKRTVGPLYSLHTELSIINNLAIETGSPYIPTIKESDGGGEGCLFDILAQGVGPYSEGGRLLERGRLFEEIPYVSTS